MPIRLVSSSPPVGQNITITLAADDRSELDGVAGRDFAKQAAVTAGFPVRGISATPMLYPVDEHGNTPPELVTGGVPVKEWRGDFSFSAGLGF